MTSKTLCVLAALMLAGCEQPVKPTSDIATDLAYFRDRFGICYAAVSSHTYGGHKSISITSVACDKVNL